MYIFRNAKKGHINGQIRRFELSVLSVKMHEASKVRG